MTDDLAQVSGFRFCFRRNDDTRSILLRFGAHLRRYCANDNPALRVCNSLTMTAFDGEMHR